MAGVRNTGYGFGITKAAGTSVKAAGASPGFDPWNKSGTSRKGISMSTKPITVSKKVYGGGPAGRTGVKGSKS